MSAKIIDGRAVSAAVRERIKKAAEGMDIKPGLAVIIVGDDPASHVYVRNKKHGCEEVGFRSWVYELPENTREEELLSLIDRLNAERDVHGILVQLPLPNHINEETDRAHFAGKRR